MSNAQTDMAVGRRSILQIFALAGAAGSLSSIRILAQPRAEGGPASFSLARRQDRISS
jgi:hypothetical protein